MHFTTSFLSLLALTSTVVAQYGSGPQSGQNMQSGQNANSNGASPVKKAPSGTSGAAAPSGSGSVKVHIIKVSNKNGSLTYSPASTNIPAGEMVQWHFYPQNHSVVQAGFNDPCHPISDKMTNVTGFFSGYMPVAKTDMMRPAWTLMINDTNPLWYYCSQKDHCQMGMVGVINPPDPSTGKTIEEFAVAAKSVAQSSIPGQKSNNGTTSGNSSQVAGSSSAAAPAASSSTFPGAANNLVAVGLTTFAGLAVACFL